MTFERDKGAGFLHCGDSAAFSFGFGSPIWVYGYGFYSYNQSVCCELNSPDARGVATLCKFFRSYYDFVWLKSMGV